MYQQQLASIECKSVKLLIETLSVAWWRRRFSRLQREFSNLQAYGYALVCCEGVAVKNGKKEVSGNK